MTEWGQTIYKTIQSGPNAGKQVVKKMPQFAAKRSIVCMARDPDYIDHTRPRKPLTRRQHLKVLDRLRNKYET